jgi:hypothetical protein
MCYTATVRIVCLTCVTRCTGQFVPIKKELYHGTSVTTRADGEDSHQPDVCSRLGRCFLVGGGKEIDLMRRTVRVIAGVRVQSKDPKSLTHGDVEACIAACPAETQ